MSPVPFTAQDTDHAPDDPTWQRYSGQPGGLNSAAVQTLIDNTANLVRSLSGDFQGLYKGADPGGLPAGTIVVDTTDFPTVGGIKKRGYTMDPKVCSGAAAVGAANRGHWLLGEGEYIAAATEIGVPVASGGGTGNISVAVYSGTGVGEARVPLARKSFATVATPATMAAGLRWVPLGAAVEYKPGEDFLFLSCDSVTPTFARISQSNAEPNQGVSLYAETQHPAPTVMPTFLRSFQSYLLMIR